MKTYFANIDDEMLGNIRTDVVRLCDHEQALAEKDKLIYMQLDIQDNQASIIEEKDNAYKQLMAQAIAIAEFATRHKLFDLPCKFLASPEVKAFLKERE